MYENGFINESELIDTFSNKIVPQKKKWGDDLKVSDLILNPPVILRDFCTVKQAITKMQNLNFKQFPVVDENHNIIGVVTSQSLIDSIFKGFAKNSSLVKEVMIKNFRKISSETPLSELVRTFT